MKALVICNGRMKHYKKTRRMLDHYDHVVAVDGGIRHARKLDIKTDAVIGDFDSVSEDDLSYIKKNRIYMIKFPTKKDKTDSELALDYCLENGYDEVTIVAYGGSRLDHSMANLTMFSRKSESMKISLIDHRNRSFFVRGLFDYCPVEPVYVSVVPMTPLIHIKKTSGLFYGLHDQDVQFGSTLCVSNYPVDTSIAVDISSGTALVIIAKEDAHVR